MPFGEEVPPQAEEFTIEASKSICKSILNTPGLFFGEHLLFKDGETDNFAIEFQQYCNRKGIDPYDYLFDEIGLVIAGTGLVSLIWKRHTEHKEQEKKKEYREKSTKEKEKEEEDLRSKVSTPKPSEKLEGIGGTGTDDMVEGLH